MDLSFDDDEAAFAAEVRAWLDEHLEVPDPFPTLDEEIAWGREGGNLIMHASEVALLGQGLKRDLDALRSALDG